MVEEVGLTDFLCEWGEGVGLTGLFYVSGKLLNDRLHENTKSIHKKQNIPKLSIPPFYPMLTSARVALETNRAALNMLGHQRYYSHLLHLHKLLMKQRQGLS